MSDIKFPFHPYKFEAKGYVVEKSDETGKKRRYLCGVSSGIKKDYHGEKMTKGAIESFMNQANSGEVLLYSDIHGIKQSQDIGRLVKGDVLPDYDWYTEYRLYDEDDGIGANKQELIDTIWNQMNGLPPYEKPIQKGFSIEGNIPDGKVLDAEKDEYGNVRRKVIDDVELDGVVLVPRQAYPDGIANAVYKALKEVPPWTVDNIKKDLAGSIKNEIENQEVKDQFYKKRWDVLDALDRNIEQIMRHRDERKEQKLEILFNEYRDLMIPLILQSSSVFTNSDIIVDQEEEEVYKTIDVEKMSKLDLYKMLYAKVVKIQKSLGD